jgi:glucosamine 6-phosphate synthetase-like amidotransferase/phosphosugar isomerase protein
MCGIVGAIANRDVVPLLVDGLKRLEYRGYDSAGIAVIDGESVRRVRRTGRVAEMEAAAIAEGFDATLGIGHTRWATHGGVTEGNAHPHISHGDLALVHNGIIENHEQQRDRLRALGYEFTSQTDTEVVAHLIHHHRAQGLSLLQALQKSVKELDGAYALAVIDRRDPSTLVAARMGCPLLVGLGEGENFVASESWPAAPATTPAGRALLAGGHRRHPVQRWRSPANTATATSVPDPRTLVVTISQSGETADTLAALRHAKSLGMEHTLTICNVATSAMVRECKLAYITRAGVEIGVASTKAFTTQLAGLFLLTLSLAKVRGRSTTRRSRHLKACATCRWPCRPCWRWSRRSSAGPKTSPQGARAVPGPRPALPDRAGRRAQAQGNLLHPRRGLPGRRAQARPAGAGRPAPCRW